MYKTFVYRLYPTKQQVFAMEEMLETHRRLYNAALEHRSWAYKQAKANITFYDQSKELPIIRREDIYMMKTNASSCQSTLYRIDKAFQSFFRRIKIGEKPGYPRFKSRKRFNKIEFPSLGNGCTLSENEHKVYFQHIGKIKIKLHRPTEGIQKTLSFVRKADGWYVLIVCDLGNAVPEPSTNPPVGIDLGLHAFIATSEGEIINAPQYFRKAQAKLRRIQRHLSRCKRNSNRRKKAVQHVAKIHQHIANQRRDFQHKVSYDLVQRYGLIAHEALNIKGLARTRLAKSINDAAWGQFLNMLTYKAESAGVQLVAVNPYNTTQMCSNCGILVPKDLSIRVHNCPDCGFVTDRDVNAALNIKRLGLSRQTLTKDMGLSVV